MGRNSCRHIEKLIFRYVNRSRTKRKISRLKFDSGLRFLARRHSKKMSKRGRIWHGGNVHKAHKHIKRGFIEELLGFFLGGRGMSGENVAMMYKGRVRGRRGKVSSDKDIARSLHHIWMRSHGHKSNILNSNFTRLGVGLKRRGKRFYATQLFYGD